MQTTETTLSLLIENHLKSNVKAIDQGEYPENFLKKLGAHGFFRSSGNSPEDVLARELQVVQHVSASCMTTGFLLWCQLAAITYIRHTENEALKHGLLPLLETCEQLAGTGLSNPMKYYGGLEELHLTATKTEDGFQINGALPSVSNIGSGHFFGVVAHYATDKRVMVMVDADTPGLSLKGKSDYLGINGSATYSCRFQDVFIPFKAVISEDADRFVPKIRPYFLAYQVPLGLGVARSSLHAIKKAQSRQNGCNSFLKTNPEELSLRVTGLQEQLEQLASNQKQPVDTNSILPLRREAVYTALACAQTEMLHVGGPAYLKWSSSSRRLREAYFLLNLTPTVRHLEKLTALKNN